MHEAHHVTDLSVKGVHLRMKVDGQFFDVDLAKESSLLANATQEQRQNIEVSPAGYGLHWPDLDEDLSVDGLIGVAHTGPLAVAEDREKYRTKRRD
jgi:hypothetical protein